MPKKSRIGNQNSKIRFDVLILAFLISILALIKTAQSVWAQKNRQQNAAGLF